MALDKNKLEQARKNLGQTKPSPESIEGFFDEPTNANSESKQEEESIETQNVEEPKKEAIPGPESVVEKKETSSEEPQEEKSKKTIRETHKVYSFWANKEQIEVWKCYQEASSALGRAQDLGLVAITEYIKNHPLEGDEALIYEAKLRQKKLDNSNFR